MADSKLAVKLDEATEETFRIILVRRKQKIQEGLAEAVKLFNRKYGKSGK